MRPSSRPPEICHVLPTDYYYYSNRFGLPSLAGLPARLGADRDFEKSCSILKSPVLARTGKTGFFRFSQGPNRKPEPEKTGFFRFSQDPNRKPEPVRKTEPNRTSRDPYPNRTEPNRTFRNPDPNRTEPNRQSRQGQESEPVRTGSRTVRSMTLTYY